MERIPTPEENPEDAKERAGMLVSELLAEFTKSYRTQIMRRERGVVGQDLMALIDRAIAVAHTEEGDEFAKAVADRFGDEIRYCSDAFAEFAEMAENTANEALEKYTGLRAPEERRKAA